VCDKSWKPRCSDAKLIANLSYTAVQEGDLGFTQPEYVYVHDLVFDFDLFLVFEGFFLYYNLDLPLGN